MTYSKKIWMVVIPLVLTIIFTIVLGLTGHPKASFMVSVGGTVLSIYSGYAYAVFLDSKKRWPGLSWRQRLTKVVFFER